MIRKRKLSSIEKPDPHMYMHECAETEVAGAHLVWFFVAFVSKSIAAPARAQLFGASIVPGKPTTQSCTALRHEHAPSPRRKDHC